LLEKGRDTLNWVTSLAHCKLEVFGSRRRRLGVGFAAVFLMLWPPSGAWAQSHRKKDEEPKPQVLPLPKEPPVALAADVGSLSFRVSPLLRSGKLAAQIRDSLNEVIRNAHGAPIIKLRAFVSGAGDTRRVQAVMSDLFTEHKLNLPVLTIVQVGALGDDASQVVIETVASERRPQNPGGLAFLASQRADSLRGSLDKLKAGLTVMDEQLKTDELKASGGPASFAPSDVVSVTCLLETLSDYHGSLSQVTLAFPTASVNIVQAQRQIGGSAAACEAVARVNETPTKMISYRPSRITVLTARQQAVFTGVQLGFGPYLDDAMAALDRLRKNAAAASALFDEVAVINVYSLSPEASSALRKTALKFQVPVEALSFQPVEGLPSPDAALGIEAIFGGPSVASVASLH
jgi:enamine deaminase RidA (YjgF/YER057c/UK114 family)